MFATTLYIMGKLQIVFQLSHEILFILCIFLSENTKITII